MLESGKIPLLHEFKSPTTPRDFSEGVLNTIVDVASFKRILV